jgi:hypothetical protein
VIIDEALIPDACFVEKTTKSIDKKAIKERIENGFDVPGAEIQITHTLLVSPR